MGGIPSAIRFVACGFEQSPGEFGAGAAMEAGLLVCDSAIQYKPRHPERTEVYRLFQDHFDSYVRAYEERFEPRSGPLRPVVVRSVEEFMSCGRLQGGFARIRCPKCHTSPGKPAGLGPGCSGEFSRLTHFCADAARA